MSYRETSYRVAYAAMILIIASLGTYMVAESATPKERIIKITTKRFDYSPAEVTVKKGVPVVLELTGKDVMMGFNLPDFGVRADIVPGKITRLRLVPDKTGTFIFLCDIFCGIGHEEMNGKLTVVD
ncbi:MAG: cytochrome-c oxidase [Betaproteobacteria bacterium]|jgi:cytochrome c oxidase subunit 2|nr:cytochrome-c oxidase [Betaproteobacteria bacterium]MEA3153381.1 cytochrome c oxidase subunit [Betaproteobacteria bacterium]